MHIDQSKTTKLATQVQFLRNLAAIDLVQDELVEEKKIRNRDKTSAELLVSFLRFYRWTYRAQNHVAYVGPSNDKYFHNLNDLGRVFHEDYVSGKGRNERFDFTICDPFNNTYNPAKVISKQNAKPFSYNFESALKKLLVKKTFIV